MHALRKLFNGLMIAMALTAIAGCSNVESAVEADFGNSVRHMIQAQTLNPQNSLLPDPEPVDSGNGDRLEGVMEAYKTDVSAPADLK